MTIPDVVALRRLHRTSFSHGPAHGAGSRARQQAHEYIEKTFARMTPGFDPRRFGTLDWDRLNANLIDLENLEYHVTHACNLACSNCSHYSDGKHTGMSSAAEADEQFGLWSSRIAAMTNCGNS